MKIIYIAKKNILNPYVSLLAGSLKEENGDLKISYYSGREFAGLIHGKNPVPSILHIHWPEIIYNENIYNKNLLNIFLAFFRTLKFLKAAETLKKYGLLHIVWTVHNRQSHEGLFPLTEKILYHNLFKITDHFIIHTPAGREFLLRKNIPENKISVIPHGTFAGYYGQGCERSEACRELGMNDNSIIFLNFGIQSPHKQTEMIIKIFNGLKRPQNTQLYLAGPSFSSVPRPQYELTEHPNVTILDRIIPDEKIPLYMSAADFLIMGHKNFLTSGVAILALSYGLPVIAPHEGDMPYIIKEGENGFLYDSEDDLIDIINRMVSLSAKEREELHETTRKNSYKHPWSAVAGETLKIYNKKID